MNKEFVVKAKTEIAKKSSQKDILTLYGVPPMLDKIVQKEKYNILNNINCGAVIIDALNKISHSSDFVVEIPEGLRKMLRSGKASFDKSTKHIGGFTPNIRINGEAGIKAQAVIIEKMDLQAVTQSLSNLAMMAMVQSVLEELNVIEQKLESIEEGQRNDRVGTIIGYFKAFMDLYPTFKTPEELNNAAMQAYMNIHSGLAQIHLQIDADRKKLNGAPTNHWKTLWLSLIHRHNETERYQECYDRYVYDIQLYNRLILLTDIVLHLKGDDNAIRNSHKQMQEYCSQYLDDKFQKNMNYLMNNDISSINNILEYNRKLDDALEGVMAKGVSLVCNKEDVKYLIFEDYESEEC